jgi:(p)ppGpp synthase/HD superfamily hydrolase
MSIILKNAIALAFKHHNGQTRKYDGTEYVQHVLRVGVKAYKCGNEIDGCIGVLHDTKEDTGITDEEIIGIGVGGDVVLAGVNELTNPSKEHKDKPRWKRKQIDREHLKKCSDRIKRIKLIDRIDNLLDLKEGPADFKLLYAGESMDLHAESLSGVSPDLDIEFFEAIDDLMETTIYGRNWRNQ